MDLTMIPRPGSEAVDLAAVVGSGESTDTGHRLSVRRIVEVKLVMEWATEERNAG